MYIAIAYQISKKSLNLFEFKIREVGLHKAMK